MKRGHLNIFHPYLSKPLNHEDQLTRALLILIRSSKLIETAFLKLVRDAMHDLNIKELPPSLFEISAGCISIETQKHSMSKSKLQTESGRLVSIIITDKRLEIEHRVNRSDRNAVYDGFIRCEPDWVFIIENKPDHNNIWVNQLSSSFSENYEIEETPVLLTWADIISCFTTMQNNGLLFDAASILVDDFLAYINEYFPELNPYSKFRMCKGIPQLLDKRCVMIMEQSEIGPVEYHRGWHHYIDLSKLRFRNKNLYGIKMATLFANTTSDGDWKVSLVLNPGAIMSQARELFKSISIESIERLHKKGWTIESDCHLSFRSSGLKWMDHKPDIFKYIKFFCNEDLKQVSKDDLPSLLKKWQDNDIISQEDYQNTLFVLEGKGYQKYNLCPGLEFKYEWTSVKAIVLDEKGDDKFANRIHKLINGVLDTWMH